MQQVRVLFSISYGADRWQRTIIIGAFTVLIASITIGVQSTKMATSIPVKNLRTE
jgi:hypothetical protein